MCYGVWVYFNKLSAIQNVHCRLLGRMVKDKLKRLWKQTRVAWLRQ